MIYLYQPIEKEGSFRLVCYFCYKTRTPHLFKPTNFITNSESDQKKVLSHFLPFGKCHHLADLAVNAEYPYPTLFFFVHFAYFFLHPLIILRVVLNCLMKEVVFLCKKYF